MIKRGIKQMEHNYDVPQQQLRVQQAIVNKGLSVAYSCHPPTRALAHSPSDYVAIAVALPARTLSPQLAPAPLRRTPEGRPLPSVPASLHLGR